jgi:glycosyltransferase involved in cell wall biosynthesis
MSFASEAGVVPRFSVVLCTRNPRRDYLDRVLAAIDGLTGTMSRELVVVDSDSSPALQERGISWPQATRIVRLGEPGIARARAAGVRAAKGNWIVFVDDDNVVDPDYLERAEEVIGRHPQLVLFCGRITGEFEQPPPPWLEKFKRQLAIIDFQSDSWASEWIPGKVPCWTAGMCVRRDIVTEYCDELSADPFVLAFATRVEDVFLVMTTVAKGHCAGLFRGLHLRHLIPPERMTVRYLCKIVHETAYNMTVLRCRKGGAGIRDLLRPIRSAAVATFRHGCSPEGQISRAAAWADVRGALACMRPERRRSL